MKQLIIFAVLILAAAATPALAQYSHPGQHFCYTCAPDDIGYIQCYGGYFYDTETADNNAYGKRCHSWNSPGGAYICLIEDMCTTLQQADAYYAGKAKEVIAVLRTSKFCTAAELADASARASDAAAATDWQAGFAILRAELELRSGIKFVNFPHAQTVTATLGGGK